MSHINALATQQKQLQQRLAQQQGRLSESQRQFDALKQQIEARFGTTEIAHLKAHYQALLAHRKQAIEMRGQLDALADQALSLIEQDQQVPQSLISQIQAQTDALKSHVDCPPQFGDSPRGSESASKKTDSQPAKPSSTSSVKIAPETQQFDETNVTIF